MFLDLSRIFMKNNATSSESPTIQKGVLLFSETSEIKEFPRFKKVFLKPKVSFADRNFLKCCELSFSNSRNFNFENSNSLNFLDSLFQLLVQVCCFIFILTGLPLASMFITVYLTNI